MDASMDEEFMVMPPPLKTREEFDFITQLCKDQHPMHMLGADMLPHLSPVLKPGFWIACRNGKRIGHVCACKFGEGNDGFCFIGLYLIDKEFREKGYGLKLWNVMWESLNKDSWNIGLVGKPDMVPIFQRIGLCPVWKEAIYILSCSKVIQSLQPVIDQSATSALRANMKTEPIDQVDFDKLSAYDTSVFGFARREFLLKWITIPNSHGLAVTNENGDIIGYAVMQYSGLEKTNQIIGPLFSDDNNVTRLLLSSLAKVAIDIKGAEYFRLAVPVGVNTCAAEMMEKEIGYEETCAVQRMYSKGAPAGSQACMLKVVALTSPLFE